MRKLHDVEKDLEFSRWPGWLRRRLGFAVLLWWLVQAVGAGVMMMSAMLVMGLAMATGFRADGIARVVEAAAHAFLALPDGDRGSWGTNIALGWWMFASFFGGLVLMARRDRGETAVWAGVRDGEGR